MNEPLLAIENLRVAYPAEKNSSSSQQLWAVNDVSLQLNYGEKLALVGESGCGKSTLGRAIMRLLPAQSCIQGEVKFKGEPVFSYNQTQLRLFRGEAIALVFQDPMTRLNPLMTIGEHCLETLKAHQPHLTANVAKKKVLDTLAAVKIPSERWLQYPHEFSGGMRQRVAIALALLLEPKLIVADEPTTSLDVTVAAEILTELTRLCAERGMALLLISHDLAMVGKYCDRVGVMYQGKIVEMGFVSNLFQSPQHEYTQSLWAAAFHLHKNKQTDTNKFETLNSLPLLEVKNLSKYFTLEGNLISQFFQKEVKLIKAVDQISFQLDQGEIFGLVGESGCGKSTLSRTILQLLKPTAGEVKFLGQNLSKLSGKEIRALRRQITMIFQDPAACLNPLMTVQNAIADPLFIHQVATCEEITKRVEAMIMRVGLIPVEDFLNRYPQELSGGQQQRVAIARALITHPQLVICDEPVSMLDASIQTQVLDLILELKAEFNLTYLFITHDLCVARFLCDRIAVMNQGKIVEMGDTEDIFTNPSHPYTQTLLDAAPSLEIENRE